MTTNSTSNTYTVNSNYVTTASSLNYSNATSSNYYATIGTSDYSQYTNAAINSYYSSREYIEEIIKEYFNKEKENKSMNVDFSFGPYNTDMIRLSPYGMAVKNAANKWVSYDRETGRLMDVEIFNISIEAKKVFYKLPKAVKDVKSGDIILHNNKPVFVEIVREDGKFEVIDPSEGTAVIILPTVSPFGFNFVTQIISLVDYMPEATEDNPFGNLLPLLLSGNDSNGLAMAMMLGKGKDFDPMLLALMGGKSDLSTILLMQMLNKKSVPIVEKP